MATNLTCALARDKTLVLLTSTDKNDTQVSILLGPAGIDALLARLAAARAQMVIEEKPKQPT